MAFKKVQEPKQIGTQMVNGKEIPILQPEVFIEVKNKKVSIEHYNEIKNLFKGEYDKKRKCTRYNITFGKEYLKWMEVAYKTKAIFKTIQ